MDENRFNRLESKIDSIQNGVSNGIAVLTSSVTGIEKDIKYMGNNFGAMKNDVDNISDEINKIKSELNSLHAVIRAIWVAFGASLSIIFWLLERTGVFARIFRYP